MAWNDYKKKSFSFSIAVCYHFITNTEHILPKKINCNYHILFIKFCHNANFTPIWNPFFFTTKACIVNSTMYFIHTFILILLFHSLIRICHYFLQNYWYNTLRLQHYLKYTLPQHNIRHKTKYVISTQFYTIQDYHWTVQTPVQIIKLNVWKHTTKTLRG